MILLRNVILAGALALIGAIVWAMGADDRGLAPVLLEMLSEPWSVVTLIDLYFGFILCAVVIALFERSWPARALWIFPIFVLGNVWTAVWFVLRLPEMARRLRGA